MSETRRRDGELVEQHDDVTPWHDPRCDAGWLPPMPDERPVPCPVCRPDVVRAQEKRRQQRLRPDRLASTAAREAAMATIRAELARARHDRTRTAS